uniref:Uncharacterized protein n=1 Tax=Timema monikensis TaxID=170555 RepID=A0A7R9EF01_9NEOP|nr:unnamed protein product [Timema monikensis]
MVLKQKEDSLNASLKLQLWEVQKHIISLGESQKCLVQQLRKELEANSTNCTLTSQEHLPYPNKSRPPSILRKHNDNSMTILLSSTSEDSQEYTPDHETSRKCREDVTQPNDLSSSNINFKLEFMSAVGLVTREALSELQNRRVERKKRSTANHMQFVYGDSWDLCQKRKKSNYLATGVSKSNSEVKRSSPAAIDIKRLSPPTKETQTQQASSSVHIPGLPSSLIIERLSSNQPLCKICRKTDNVKVCTNCVNSYHESCAKDSEGSCPECYSRSQEEIVHSYSDEKTSLTISERTRVKLEELKKNNHLHVEQSGLEQRAAVLRSALAVQAADSKELLKNEANTRFKIQRIQDFIKAMQILLRRLATSVSTLGLRYSESSVDKDAPPSKRVFQ